jgi:hypothetical protein
MIIEAIVDSVLAQMQAGLEFDLASVPAARKYLARDTMKPEEILAAGQLFCRYPHLLRNQVAAEDESPVDRWLNK